MREVRAKRKEVMGNTREEMRGEIGNRGYEGGERRAGKVGCNRREVG